MMLHPSMPIWVWILSSSVVLLTIVKNLSILHFCQNHVRSSKNDIFLSEGSYFYFLLKLNTFRLISGVLFQQLPIFGIQYFIFEKIDNFRILKIINNSVYFFKNCTILINLLSVVQYGTRKKFIAVYGLAFGALLLSIVKMVPFLTDYAPSRNLAKCNFEAKNFNPFSLSCISQDDWLFLGSLAFLQLQTVVLLLLIMTQKTNKTSDIC